ncbi:hypothetical protein JCM14469_21090 [Desulfatiferula olefinivorans]
MYSEFTTKHNNINQKGLNLDHINNAIQSQANIDVQGKIDDFFGRFKVDDLVKSKFLDGFVKCSRSRLANPEE